jgi:2-phosphosulfolactate phosphatase
MTQRESSSPETPLEVRLFATPREVAEDDLRGCAVVVVDVLRSSSSMISGLMNGAREIIPVLSPAEAGELASRMGRDMSLLCGEREGRKIDGFDLGNSPYEYSPERVAGRILIFSSTNGPAAVLRARLADRLYVGGYNNFGAVLRRIHEDGKPVVVMCAGKEGHFAIEDFVCGGKFVVALETRFKRRVVLNDGARAAALLHRHFDGSLPSLLKSCEHGKYLLSLSAENDLEFCARMDTHPIVPMWIEGKIRGFNPDGTPLEHATGSL